MARRPVADASELDRMPAQPAEPRWVVLYWRSLFTRLVLVALMHPEWDADEVARYLTGKGELDAREMATCLHARRTNLAEVWKQAAAFAAEHRTVLVDDLMPVAS